MDLFRRAEAPRGQPVLALGEASYDPDTRRLLTPGGVHVLEPGLAGALTALARRPGLTLSWSYLAEAVAAETGASGEGPHRAVVRLRLMLGDDVRAPRFIETVSGVGYRWIFAPPRRAAAASEHRSERGTRAFHRSSWIGRRLRSPWALGPLWVGLGAALAVAVGGGGVAAYAWVQADPSDTLAARAEHRAYKPCLDRGRSLREEGRASYADRALGGGSPPGCRLAEPARKVALR